MNENANFEIDSITMDIPDTLLSSQININIANFITHEACRKYYDIYQNAWVPLSFIEFIFDEYRRVDFMSPIYLTPFFAVYTPDDLPAIIESYYNSEYCLIKRKSNRKDEVCYLIDDLEYLDINLSSKDVLGVYSPELYSNLGNISSHLEKSDELLTTREIYETFMMKKIVLAHTKKIEKKLESQIPNMATTNNGNRVHKADTTLIGEKSEVPQLKGKVVKIYFPKLLLPSAYPTLMESSRINSSYRVKLFLSPAKEISLINKYKFNAVKYKTGFIEKRKAAKKPSKPKFDFDF